MPSINVNGRYCLFPYVGASASTTFRDSTYVNNICSVSTPNPLGFSLYLPYIPGLTQPNQGLTTIAPGSSYQIISRDAFATTKWSITYAGADVDRLPAAINVKSPLFMIGLDKNSIVVPISSYALGENSPLSSIGQMRLSPGGAYDAINTFYAEQIKKGQFFGDTHFRPNSAYRLRNRVPFTFFAPLQSEMGNAYAIGRNIGGEYGMGYRNNNNSFPGDNIYGKWDKIVFGLTSNCTDNGQTVLAPSIAALSSCGASKALFVLGNNVKGQLGTNSTQQYYATWTRVPGQWLDVTLGWDHMLAIDSQGRLYACGDNAYGQLGLGSGIPNRNTLLAVDTVRTYVEIAAYTYSSMARDSNGFLYAWGYNLNGQLGVGNNTTKIYTPTREVLNYTWTSLYGGGGYFVAISNKRLFGTSNPTGGVSYEYGNVTNTPAVPYAFTQEDLNLTDVIGFIPTFYGTFIRRENQDRYFTAGFNGGSTSNFLVPLTAGDRLNYFTKSLIPSDATAIASYSLFNNYNISYIKDNIRYSKQGGSGFTQNNDNYYNMFNNYNTLYTLRGAIPTPTPTITPTRTPAPTRTPTPTPSTTPASIYPQANGARLAQFFSTTTNTRTMFGLSLIYSDDFDNWTDAGRIYDPRGPGTNQILYPTGCIPGGAAFTSSLKTLFLFHSKDYPENTDNKFRIIKSNNTNVTFVPSLTLTDGNAFTSGSFWDENIQKLCIVFCRQQYSSTSYPGFWAYTYDPIDNTFSNPVQISADRYTKAGFYSFYTGQDSASNELVQKSPNGQVYLPYVLNIGGINTGKIKILTYQRGSNFPQGWQELPVYDSIQPAGTASVPGAPECIRVGFWNDGTPVLGYIYGVPPDQCGYGNLYLNLFNKDTNTWITTPTLIGQDLPYGGRNSFLPLKGYYVPYDMFVNPLENILYIVYIVNIQPRITSSSVSRHTIRLRKINQQGTTLSDVLVYDCAVGPPAGTPINGYYTSSAGRLSMFYKSNGSNFDIYFTVKIQPTSSPASGILRVFKYQNNNFSIIYTKQPGGEEGSTGLSGPRYLSIT
jgi:hypothetical protein